MQVLGPSIQPFPSVMTPKTALQSSLETAVTWRYWRTVEIPPEESETFPQPRTVSSSPGWTCCPGSGRQRGDTKSVS